MIGVDTNVVVRLIAADDEQQTAAALDLMESQGLQVSLLALLEAEWVLRSAHGYSRRQTAEAFRGLLALDKVEVDEALHVRWAIDRHEHGADLADMLLLVASRPIGRLATFDRRLTRQAGPDAPVEVVTLS